MVGIVTQEGQTVIASQLTPVILKLADLDTMTVKAQVSEADVIHITPGKRCISPSSAMPKNAITPS